MVSEERVDKHHLSEPSQDLKDIIREDFLEEMGSTFSSEDRVRVNQEKESRRWLRWQVQPGQRPGGLLPSVVQGGWCPCWGGHWRGGAWVLLELTQEAVKDVSRKAGMSLPLRPTPNSQNEPGGKWEVRASQGAPEVTGDLARSGSRSGVGLELYQGASEWFEVGAGKRGRLPQTGGVIRPFTGWEVTSGSGASGLPGDGRGIWMTDFLMGRAC
ncbi:hypothetical protein Cadr_000031119 [Camelus dromedarius]|uniref:Uncharacterized protein n=1 Tax=Camelus dromedarius TaxID=9838 RepID=A0A5N4C0C0_CAMDR|nr:hypothetical protein Cadr_000031119 [Camelus dromedarius]